MAPQGGKQLWTACGTIGTIIAFARPCVRAAMRAMIRLRPVEEVYMTEARPIQLELVQPDPAQAHKMPYAPAVHIVGASRPDVRIRRNALAALSQPSRMSTSRARSSLRHRRTGAPRDGECKAGAGPQGCDWRDVVKITKYLTDMRDFDGLHRTLAPYFGDWQPASTTICVNQLSSPGARIELDMIVALPKSA